MGPCILLLVMCVGLVVADRKMTVAEKLKEDADLSQVYLNLMLHKNGTKQVFELGTQKFSAYSNLVYYLIIKTYSAE